MRRNETLASNKFQELSKKQGKTSQLRILFSVGLLIIWLVIGYFAFKDVSNFINWIEELGPAAPILFTIMVSIAVVLLVPTPILKVGSGAIFPYWVAVVVNFTASIIGGLMAFLLGRWLFRDRIAQIVSGDDRLKRLEMALNEEAMQISVLVRLSPIVPDEWLNYVMSGSPVSTRVFFISNLSSIVYSLAYAYFGHAAGKIVLSGDGMSGFKESPGGNLLLIMGVLASIIVTVLIARVTMKALYSKVEIN